MKQEIAYVKIKLALGSVSLLVGLSAATFAFFNWIERTNMYYLLGNYARYVCAYGGFAAMIFGAMLIDDFFVSRKLDAISSVAETSKVDSDFCKILGWIADEYSENLRKSSSNEAKLTRRDYLLETEEEVKVNAQ